MEMLTNGENIFCLLDTNFVHLPAREVTMVRSLERPSTLNIPHAADGYDLSDSYAVLLRKGKGKRFFVT